MARTPRINYVRHGSYGRLRHSRILLEWLNAQATRLSLTALAVFQLLKDGYSAAQIDLLAGAAPVNSVAPTIVGTATENEQLTADVGTWSEMGSGSYSFAWKRDAVDIVGATDAAYTLVTADVGTTITVAVTATNSAGSTTVTSAGVGPVASAA